MRLVAVENAKRFLLSRLLEPLVAQNKMPAAGEDAGVPPSQDLARAYNALATLMRDQKDTLQSRALYERAIAIAEALAKQKDNREYKVELATWYNNLAFLLWDENELEAGKQRNFQALDLIDELATPTPAVEEQRAKALLLRALIGQSNHPDYANLASHYLNAARKGLQSGSLADAADALNSMSLLAPQLAEPARSRLLKTHDDLEKELTEKKANRK